MEEFEKLFDEINRLREDEAQQYIAVELDGGKILGGTNEFKLAEAIGGKAVAKILCVWRNGEVDLPSVAFRKLLCSLNSRSTHAKILIRTFLGGSEELAVKELSATLPRNKL